MLIDKARTLNHVFRKIKNALIRYFAQIQMLINEIRK